MIEPDPDATFTVVLQRHADKPRETQPRFVFRMLRRRQSKALMALLVKLQGLKAGVSTAEEGIALVDALEAFIARLLVGWENQTDDEGNLVPFTPGGAGLDLVIDDADLVEIALQIPRQSMLTASDRKKSGSQSRSSSASPASNAPSAMEVSGTAVAIV
jgi:hypothetical protein